MMTFNKTKSIKDKREPVYSIFRGARRNDLVEVENALNADSQCINAQERGLGPTALHIAAADGNKALVQFLMSQPGCRFDIEDQHGRTPALLAFVVGRDDIADIIYSAILNDLDVKFPGDSFDANTLLDESAAVLSFQRAPRPKDP